MQQSQLFHDSIFDALGADIAAVGGIKKVSALLWPGMDTTTAAAKLRATLNPEQPHKLCLDEVILVKRLARDAGSTATIDYEAQQLGYQIEWISPEDDKARLQREFVDMGKRMERILMQLNAADQRVRAVK